MWHLAPGQQLRHWSSGEEYVLYNDLSGDTHLLGEPALHVLSFLQHSSADEAAIADALGAAFDTDPDGDLGADVAELLDTLQALSLVEC